MEPTEHSGKEKAFWEERAGTYGGRRAQRCRACLASITDSGRRKEIFVREGRPSQGKGLMLHLEPLESMPDTLEASIKTISGQGADPLGAGACTNTLYPGPLVHSEALLARLARS